MFVVNIGCRLMIIARDFSGFNQRLFSNVIPLTADIDLDFVGVHVAMTKYDHVHEVVYEE
jgi:hypothetical protein